MLADPMFLHREQRVSLCLRKLVAAHEGSPQFKMALAEITSLR